ncbi:hypothetical protein Tco_0686348 [Tanacetum coccineum]
MSLTKSLHEFGFFFSGHRVMASIRAIILSVLEFLLPSSAKAMVFLRDDCDHDSFGAFPSYEAKRRLEIRSRVERKLGFLRGVDSEEFVNVFMRIGFGSFMKLVSFDKSQVVTFDSKFVSSLRNSDCRTRSQNDNMALSTRMEYLDQTERELKIDFNKPLKEQDHLNELNELANKKRKRTSDLKDHSMSTKKHKSSSSSSSTLHVLRILGSIFTLVYEVKLKLVVSLLEGLQGGKKIALCQKE